MDCGVFFKWILIVRCYFHLVEYPTMPISCQKSNLRQREDVHGSHFLNSIQRLVTIAMGIQPLVTMAMIIQQRVTMKMGTGPNF